MKSKRLFLVFVFGVGLTLLVSATVSNQPTRAQGTCDRYVLAFDGADSGDCSDENLPCRTVQYAINQASDGDVICVADYVDVIILGRRPTPKQSSSPNPSPWTVRWESASGDTGTVIVLLS